MSKKNIAFISCVASVCLGLGAVAAGLAINAIGATIALFVVGGALIAGGALVGLPYAFMEDVEAERNMKNHNKEKEPLVEVFESERKKEEEKIVVDNLNKKEDTKNLNNDREL